MTPAAKATLDTISESYTVVSVDELEHRTVVYVNTRLSPMPFIRLLIDPNGGWSGRVTRNRYRGGHPSEQRA